MRGTRDRCTNNLSGDCPLVRCHVFVSCLLQDGAVPVEASAIWETLLLEMEAQDNELCTREIQATALSEHKLKFFTFDKIHTFYHSKSFLPRCHSWPVQFAQHQFQYRIFLQGYVNESRQLMGKVHLRVPLGDRQFAKRSSARDNFLVLFRRHSS